MEHGSKNRSIKRGRRYEKDRERCRDRYVMLTICHIYLFPFYTFNNDENVQELKMSNNLRAMYCLRLLSPLCVG